MCNNATLVSERGASWTVEEFAQRTGMTVRNIRAHQSRGLLHPPVVRGRTGFYGQAHAERVALIQRLQGEGFNLESSRRLISAGGGEPLRLLQTISDSLVTEQPEVVTLDEAARQWGDDGPVALERGIELGLVRWRDDGRLEYPSPRLIRAALQTRELGVPVGSLLDLVAQMRKHADKIAELYVQLFLDHVWEPFERAGSPDDRWADVRAALERLGPLTGDVLQVVFATAMTAASERTFDRKIAPSAGQA